MKQPITKELISKRLSSTYKRRGIILLILLVPLLVFMLLTIVNIKNVINNSAGFVGLFSYLIPAVVFLVWFCFEAYRFFIVYNVVKRGSFIIKEVTIKDKIEHNSVDSVEHFSILKMSGDYRFHLSNGDRENDMLDIGNTCFIILPDNKSKLVLDVFNSMTYDIEK